MRLSHAHVLAQARTYLYALALDAADEDACSNYHRVLIELDRIHADQSPAVFHDVITGDRAALVSAATDAIEELKQYGIDPLSIELVLWMLEHAHSLEQL